MMRPSHLEIPLNTNLKIAGSQKLAAEVALANATHLLDLSS